MKTLVAVLVAIGILMMGGIAFAAGTTTVGVSANVLGRCGFNTAGTVAFGDIDPTNAPVVTPTITQPTLWCTNGTTYTITDDKGLHESGTTFRMQHDTDATQFIPYTFTYTASGTGAGKTSPITMNIGASIAAGTYSDAKAGAYADTVTLTINP